MSVRGKDNVYLKIGTDQLENIVGDLSFAITNGTIPVKDDDSDGFEEKIAGDQDIVISGTFFYQLEADTATAQIALMTAATTNAVIPIVEWGYETGTGIDAFTATATASVTPDRGDAQKVAFAITILSKPVITAQT